jgi:hypothetical protein
MNEMINKSIDITLFDKETTNATTSRDNAFKTIAGSQTRFMDTFNISSNRNSTTVHHFALAQNSSRTNQKHDIDS